MCSPQSISRPGTAIIILLAMSLSSAWGQSFEQTLPPGFLNTHAGSGTSLPFRVSTNNKTQWHYDATNFLATGPIMINEIYVRPQHSNQNLQNFAYANVEVILIEASTDWNTPNPVFAGNVIRAEKVRDGAYTQDFDFAPTNAATGAWIPLRLKKGFSYNPATGHDLIVQVRVCGIFMSMGFNIEGAGGHAASWRGDTSNCNATSAAWTSTSFAPLVKIDYTLMSSQSLPNGYLHTNGSGATSYPFNTSSDQKWQWHYDSSEFIANGPITITEIAVRADSVLANVPAFNINNFEVTLIEASTDYQVGSHDSVFANNILRSKVVRSSYWTPEPTPAILGGTATWISFQLEDTFDYDPSTGNDFIVQLRTCFPTSNWGTLMDLAIGPPGTVGGNRYGHTSDCSASASVFNNDEAVPIIKIDYCERTISTLPWEESFDHWGARHGTTRVPPGWLQHPSNAGNWRHYYSSTSVGTASSDHTTGRGGIGFYVSSDDSYSSGIEILETPILDLGNIPTPIASFWIYSYSVLAASNLDENTLHVDVKRYGPGSTTQILPDRIQPVRVLRHGCWTKYCVDLAPFVTEKVSLIFSAETDSAQGYYHDFALDDFHVGPRQVPGGGQAPTPQAALDINDCWTNNGFHVDYQDPGPYYAQGRPSGLFRATVSGAQPFQPMALWVGPLNIAVATFGSSGQMDTGTPDTTGDGIPESIFLLGSGLNPNPSFLDLFFFTDGSGEMSISLPLNPALPMGTLGTFQAAVADGTGSIYLSNAVVFNIVP